MNRGILFGRFVEGSCRSEARQQYSLAFETPDKKVHSLDYQIWADRKQKPDPLEKGLYYVVEFKLDSFETKDGGRFTKPSVVNYWIAKDMNQFQTPDVKKVTKVQTPVDDIKEDDDLPF